MPYVVPRNQSVQYTGQNMEAIQAIVNQSDYWQSAEFLVTEERIKWSAGEGDRINIPVGGYLVYNTEMGTYQGLSQADYEAQYHEIA
jgi:hypothetical protein